MEYPLLEANSGKWKSQYLKDKKSKEISKVAASEMEIARVYVAYDIAE